MSNLNIEKMEKISGGGYANDWKGCAASIFNGACIGGAMFGPWGAIGGGIIGGLLDC